MATPNETNDLHTRVQLAKLWLRENPSETISAAARIFKVNRTTISMSIKSNSTTRLGGSNRILTPSQELAINGFIRSCLENSQLPTQGVIRGAINHVRKQEGKDPPSQAWFKKWWKRQPLRKISTNPISKERITAQDREEVKSWFKKYKDVILKHKIHRKDIWNFDETGFRIGCPKGETIYVPEEVREVGYYITLNNY
jgi:hypothetical protein